MSSFLSPQQADVVFLAGFSLFFTGARSYRTSEFARG